jgi:hypothetical protein
MSTANSVDQLIDAVKQLSPDEFSQFTIRLAEIDGPEGEAAERFLVQQTKLQLPTADSKRLRALVSLSERGELNPDDLVEYRHLAARAERINATRVCALAELATRRKQPINVVKKEVGWPEETHGA